MTVSRRYPTWWRMSMPVNNVITWLAEPIESKRQKFQSCRRSASSAEGDCLLLAEKILGCVLIWLVSGVSRLASVFVIRLRSIRRFRHWLISLWYSWFDAVMSSKAKKMAKLWKCVIQYKCKWPDIENNDKSDVSAKRSWRMKDQLDVTCYFISLLMCSTCFGH